MNILVISDIHGDIETLNNILINEQYDKIVFLGDFCGYSSHIYDLDIYRKLKTLNSYIVCGNCDLRYKDELDIPISLNIEANNKRIIATHGHSFDDTNKDFDIFMQGHTHISKVEKKGNKIYINPGSISRPKDGSIGTYILITKDKIVLKDVHGKVINLYNL